MGCIRHKGKDRHTGHPGIQKREVILGIRTTNARVVLCNNPHLQIRNISIIAKRTQEVPRPQLRLEGHDITKSTFVKIHCKYLLPESLDTYKLPWEWSDIEVDHHISSSLEH